MNKTKDRNGVTISLLLFCLILVGPNLSVYSQGFAGPPTPGGGDSGAGFDDDTEDQIVPIDGLVIVGLVAGSIYGIRKKYRN